MIPSLAREQFLDLAWGPTNLDAAAEFWLKLYESAAKVHSFTPLPAHRTELRLGGFPRADAERLAALFLARADSSGFGPPRIVRPDPDSLQIGTASFDGRDAPPSGLGLTSVSGEEFDGLLIEIRFTARDGKAKATSALVLAGELRGGSFNLKSARRAGQSRWDDAFAPFNAWANESAFLVALEEFRATGAVPEKLARKLYPPRGADRIAALTLSLLYVPLDKPRLAGLLTRVLILVGLLAAFSSVSYWLWETNRVPMLAPVGPLTVFLFWVLSIFLRTEIRVWRFGYKQLNALYAEFDQESPRLVPLTHSESAQAGNDPYARKFTADLIAAGFALLGDARLTPAGIGRVFYRVFGAPDGMTYLAVVHQSTNTLEAGKEYHFWPSFASFACHTFLRGGAAAASLNGQRHGYRRKRSGPERFVRVFPEKNDPVAFVQLHAEAVAKFVSETGNSPLRHARFEEYIRLQNALAEEERCLFADSPYTLGDHLHWYLQIPRREYRG